VLWSIAKTTQIDLEKVNRMGNWKHKKLKVKTIMMWHWLCQYQQHEK